MGTLFGLVIIVLLGLILMTASSSAIEGLLAWGLCAIIVYFIRKQNP